MTTEGSSAGDGAKKLLLDTFQCFTGQLDLEKLAQLQGVSTAAAMQKRLKRYFDREGVTVSLKGNIIGGSSDANGNGPATTPAPKRRATKPKAEKAMKTEVEKEDEADDAAVEGSEDEGSPSKKRKV